MENLIKSGRTFFGIALVALGIQQFFYADFRPVFLPSWPSWIPGLPLWAYLAGVALIAAGAAIITGKKARLASLVLGTVLLVLFVFGHIPYQLINNPTILGAWTNALKELALSGGAFIVAGSFPEERSSSGSQSSTVRLLDKFIPFGRFFFSITMIIFGIDHFLYADFVATLVPAWIPGPIFWTYFAGVALVGSGVSIILKIKVRLVATLLGTMIFLWFVFLHIPRAFADPYTQEGNEVTSVFQALAFSGIAFILAAVLPDNFSFTKTKVAYLSERI